MVRYYNDSCTYRLPEKRRTSAWLKSVAEQEGYTLGEVTYIFCSSQVHRKMNIDFIGHDYFTDVITFDYSDRKGEKIVSGDIFIDVETVADNARIYGATKLHEMRRVVVLRSSTRCAAWWCMDCCTSVARRTRRRAPRSRCTARKINI